jgi:hypothetical protein
MFSPEPPLRLFKRGSFAAFELFHALTDRRYSLGALQSVEQGLIAVGILDDEFSPAIDR